MDIKEFKKNAHKTLDYIFDYYENIEKLPVKSQAAPGDIINKLPEKAPEKPEDYDQILKDFDSIIMPGITHWQHPNFHAYFNSNGSFPSFLGEMLSTAIGAQCMIWQTSPAAAELEQRVMEWLRDLCGLPGHFHGVIQDSASTSTLVSILTAREKVSAYDINRHGFRGSRKYSIYCSAEAHSSIDKAVRIAGFGADSLKKVSTDENFAMIPSELNRMIEEDIDNDVQPLAVIAAIGTTSSVAIDPLKEISDICNKRGLWLHVDGAHAGTAMILPEFRYMIEGIELADSYVFNPHKWMFTNFDCSAYFVRDKEALIKTFSILPEYLKTEEDKFVNNYRDWGIQLGRRFRALKLWFVLRSFGAEGLRKKISGHINIAKDIAEKIETHPDFEILAPVNLNVICFRYFHPEKSEMELNAINESILKKINASGEIYITHTKLKGKYTLRLVLGQTEMTERHAAKAWQVIKQYATQ